MKNIYIFLNIRQKSCKKRVFAKKILTLEKKFAIFDMHLQKKFFEINSLIDFNKKLCYSMRSLLKKRLWKSSLKTEQNVDFLSSRLNITQKDFIFFWRVSSWLRMNAGGMPKTCKSNEVALWGMSACTNPKKDFPPSGRRVSNTWVTYL